MVRGETSRVGGRGIVADGVEVRRRGRGEVAIALEVIHLSISTRARARRVQVCGNSYTDMMAHGWSNTRVGGKQCQLHRDETTAEVSAGDAMRPGAPTKYNSPVSDRSDGKFGGVYQQRWSKRESVLH